MKKKHKVSKEQFAKLMAEDLRLHPVTPHGVHRERDELFEDAVAFARQHDSVNSSLLGGRFSIGYARAAGLFDELKEAGVIVSDGSLYNSNSVSLPETRKD